MLMSGINFTIESDFQMALAGACCHVGGRARHSLGLSRE